jgi:Domain of unknown function (DUF4272)
MSGFAEEIARALVKALALREGIELQSAQRSPQLDPAELPAICAKRAELERWAHQHLELDSRERWAVVASGGAGRAAMELHWRGEWVTVLAWILGITDAVPEPEHVGAWDQFPKYLDLTRPPELFETARVVRSPEELAAMKTRLSRSLATWLERFPLAGRAPVGDDGMARSRAIERYRAIEWALDRASRNSTR